MKADDFIQRVQTYAELLAKKNGIYLMVEIDERAKLPNIKLRVRSEVTPEKPELIRVLKHQKDSK